MENQKNIWRKFKQWFVNQNSLIFSLCIFIMFGLFIKFVIIKIIRTI